jgi:hypothetical protein
VDQSYNRDQLQNPFRKTDMDVAASQLEALPNTEEFTALTCYTNSFDLFKVMGVSTKELVHSNIIAALLSEQEPHGLAASFRDAYIESLSDCRCVGTPFPQQTLASTAGARAKVSRELAHLDILLDFPALRIVIAIENKIWAKDQPNQIAKYQQALCDLYPHYPFRALVYLTPTGRDSPTINKDSTVPVYYQSYGQLAALLRQHQARASHAAGHFIAELVTHVEKTMSGNSELKQLCWSIFEQNEEAYEQLVNNYQHCLTRKLDERFANLQQCLTDSNLFAEWSGLMETQLTRNPAKRHYDLDVRLRTWPAGVWVKIYKHSWFGVFPYFLDSGKESLAKHLPVFTTAMRQVPDWSRHYLASVGFLVREDRRVYEAGDKATETNQALSIVRECIIEINQALTGGIAQPITEPNSFEPTA